MKLEPVCDLLCDFVKNERFIIFFQIVLFFFNSGISGIFFPPFFYQFLHGLDERGQCQGVLLKPIVTLGCVALQEGNESLDVCGLTLGFLLNCLLVCFE